MFLSLKYVSRLLLYAKYWAPLPFHAWKLFSSLDDSAYLCVFLIKTMSPLTTLITEWEQVLALCQEIITSNSERLPDINIYQLKVLDCAMDACINLGMLEEALFYAMRTMEPYR